MQHAARQARVVQFALMRLRTYNQIPQATVKVSLSSHCCTHADALLRGFSGSEIRIDERFSAHMRHELSENELSFVHDESVPD